MRTRTVGPGPFFHESDDAVAAYVRRDLSAGFLQFFGDAFGGFGFLVGELRVGMEVGCRGR